MGGPPRRTHDRNGHAYSGTVAFRDHPPIRGLQLATRPRVRRRLHHLRGRGRRTRQSAFGPTCSDAFEALRQRPIERQFTVRRRFAIQFAIQTQAVILARLKSEDVLDIQRCSALMRDTPLEPQDRVPWRPLRFCGSGIPSMLIAQNTIPFTDRASAVGEPVFVVDDLSDEGLLKSVWALRGVRFQRLAGSPDG